MLVPSTTPPFQQPGHRLLLTTVWDVVIRFISPQFVENPQPKSKRAGKRLGRSVGVASSRLQDRSLQEMRDEGCCLSMHQPWASLLVAGIKRSVPLDVHQSPTPTVNTVAWGSGGQFPDMFPPSPGLALPVTRVKGWVPGRWVVGSSRTYLTQCGVPSALTLDSCVVVAGVRGGPGTLHTGGDCGSQPPARSPVTKR